MRVSRRKINSALERELFGMFYQLIADLKTRDEAKQVFEDLLGKTEVETFVKRLGIIYWLSKGRSVSNIRENLAVSSATVESMKHQINKSNGLKLALKKITADEWATRWAQRIRKLVK